MEGEWMEGSEGKKERKKEGEGKKEGKREGEEGRLRMECEG